MHRNRSGLKKLYLSGLEPSNIPVQDIGSVLLLLGATQGIFFSMVLLALPGGNRQANRWLAVLLTAFSINIGGTALYELRLVLNAPHLGFVQTPFAMLLGISTWFFTKNFTEKHFRMKWWHWLNLMPFALVVLYFIPFYRLPAAAKRTILEASYTHMPDFWVNAFHATNLITAVYIALTIVLILRHERHIRQVFSNTEKKSLRWLMQFIFGGSAVFVVCVVLSVNDVGFADMSSNLIFSGIIYVLGYRAIRQPEIFTNIPAEVVAGTNEPVLLGTRVRYEKSGLSAGKVHRLLEKLDAVIMEQKIYLDPDLTLPQLADRLGATPHQVSQLLNQYQEESFFDFINRQRVEHFKKAVLDPANAHLSILAIAFDSGFNSKATFNAVFKKITGMTPSAFRNF